MLYRPRCPECTACEAIRLDTQMFAPNKTQRRIQRRGRELVRLELGEPTLSHEKVALYNKHKLGRELMGEGDPIDETGYGAFLVDSCTDSFEIRYILRGEEDDDDEQLVGVAIVDRGSDALSAVYTYFDPELGPLSLGVFSILEQIELCKRWGLRWLYLGLFVGSARRWPTRRGICRTSGCMMGGGSCSIDSRTAALGPSKIRFHAPNDDAERSAGGGMAPRGAAKSRAQR